MMLLWILKITLSKKKFRSKSEVYNIGNGKPVHLRKYIKEIELCLGKKAKIENLPLPNGRHSENSCLYKKNSKKISNLNQNLM